MGQSVDEILAAARARIQQRSQAAAGPQRNSKPPAAARAAQDAPETLPLMSLSAFQATPALAPPDLPPPLASTPHDATREAAAGGPPAPQSLQARMAQQPPLEHAPPPRPTAQPVRWPAAALAAPAPAWRRGRRSAAPSRLDRAGAARRPGRGPAAATAPAPERQAPAAFAPPRPARWRDARRPRPPAPARPLQGAPTRSGQRAAGGPLVETIPRQMRVGAPAAAQVRIGRDKVDGLVHLLMGGRATHRPDAVAAQALTVRLRAPEGGFAIEALTPETQWVEPAAGRTVGRAHRLALDGDAATQRAPPPAASRGRAHDRAGWIGARGGAARPCHRGGCARQLAPANRALARRPDPAGRGGGARQVRSGAVGGRPGGALQPAHRDRHGAARRIGLHRRVGLPPRRPDALRRPGRSAPAAPPAPPPCAPRSPAGADRPPRASWLRRRSPAASVASSGGLILSILVSTSWQETAAWSITVMTARSGGFSPCLASTSRNTRMSVGRPAQVVPREPRPLLDLGLGRLRRSRARHVDDPEIDARRPEEVQLLRTAGRVGGACEPAMADERVDEARLADVGAPGERDLGAGRGGEMLQAGRAAQEPPGPAEQVLARGDLLIREYAGRHGADPCAAPV